MSIVVIDYGSGNPASVQNMLRKVGAKSCVSSNVDEIAKAHKLILPGVGSFDSGISQLLDSGLVPILNDLVLGKKLPILGICLGMQLMTNCSEEGKLSGLGWIEAETIKFSLPVDQRLRVPHMGWNVAEVKKPNMLFDPHEIEERFYFVHSYYVSCRDRNDVLTETSYGIKFASSFQRGNIIGVQFHPEKSHRFGFQLLRRFAENFSVCEERV